MTWFYVDDKFWSHPKTLGITMNAVGVWTLAGSWCAAHLTDGYIPADALHMVCRRNVNKSAIELVTRKLWTEEFDGWSFVDWTQWQQTKAQVEAKREAARIRQARRRHGDGTYG